LRDSVGRENRKKKPKTPLRLKGGGDWQRRLGFAETRERGGSFVPQHGERRTEINLMEKKGKAFQKRIKGGRKLEGASIVESMNGNSTR